MTDDPAGRSFARSRGEVVAALAAAMRAAGVAAMVYPTMPFNAPRAVDPWPDIRTTLGYGNWLGLPEVSVPAGIGADGMPALNVSVVGLPGDDGSELRDTALMVALVHRYGLAKPEYDARVLALAHAYEHQSRRFVAPPRPR
jgi:Asp-tRNA(Asn)/Glu-tRNA(Gln) amidotransferase A subunit family amidase